jgi:hypothetical protein
MDALERPAGVADDVVSKVTDRGSDVLAGSRLVVGERDLRGAAGVLGHRELLLLTVAEMGRLPVALVRRTPVRLGSWSPGPGGADAIRPAPAAPFLRRERPARC